MGVVAGGGADGGVMVEEEVKAKRQLTLPFLVFAPSPCGRGLG